MTPQAPGSKEAPKGCPASWSAAPLGKRDSRNYCQALRLALNETRLESRILPTPLQSAVAFPELGDEPFNLSPAELAREWRLQ